MIIHIFLQIRRPYVIAKRGDYPQFRAIAIAIEKYGFKIKASSI
ncbi:hypothetical protein HanXRQr2_Chr02g0070341 [Helianthus annuus]|uniref:Uncharacterized protein n=1 Tax=Helianthus annuus TaxID=4232 RepID=A0A9K3NZV2_HELAN|nr:hypothetical protein HanXRQr2_Chr02g0070341 [Helianthus annuus]KAJ0952111.1 hypothetical protein HanPSC8_Chr02g0068311 [Helianthus annuus]